MYLRGRFEALLQSGVVAPAVRALYGKRIRFPIGSDFGISSRLVERQLRMRSKAGAELRCGWRARRYARVFRSARPARSSDPAQKDPPEVSAAVAQVLGALFLDIDRNATYWQKVRGSQSVPTFGTGGTAADEPGTVDVSRIIETSNWISQPSGRVERSAAAGHTARAEAAHRPHTHQLPATDDLWARIVYDFALAHRLRIMNRDHLLRAMTPVYSRLGGLLHDRGGKPRHPPRSSIASSGWEPHSNHRNRTSCPAGGGRIAFNP